MRFIADCMLGRLAKWLRILGFDVVYFSRASDSDLVEIARQEGRILLTRDTGLIEKARKRKDRLFVRSEDWKEQVVQVLDEYRIWEDVRLYSRCLSCNRGLKPLPKSKARNLVTPFVLDNATDFALCPDCGRVFWRGSHSGDMERRIESIFALRPKKAATTRGKGSRSSGASKPGGRQNRA